MMEPIPIYQPDLDPPVKGFLHRPANPSDGLILTHGAGANCRSPLLTSLATELCDKGVTVLRCDLPFRQARPYGPPFRSAERDQQGLKRAVEWIRQQAPGRIFLGGHSYGGRQASMLAAAEPGLVEGLLLLSYPLHPPKKPEQMRTAHFANLHTPALFVCGTRDGFASMEELTSALKLIPAMTQMIVVEGAGHELLAKRGDPKLIAEITAAFKNAFL